MLPARYLDRRRLCLRVVAQPSALQVSRRSHGDPSPRCDTSAPGGVSITGLAHVANAAVRAGARLLCSFLRPLGDPNYIGELETLV